MMGTGTRRIDVATLRRLLPLWMKSDGFHVCFSFGENGSVRDSMLVSSTTGRVRSYLSRMLLGLTIEDGKVAYTECNIAGTVLIRVWEDE